MYMLLLVISVLRSLDTLIINDLFELGKPIYFLLFFSMAYNIRWNDVKVVKYFSALMLFLLFGALIGIGESFIPAVNTVTTVVYKSNRAVLSHKAVFSFIITYAFATILLLPIFFYFIKLIQRNNSSFVFDLGRFLVFLLCFVLTQSRTIFLSLLLTFVLFLCLILLNRWYPNRRRILAVSVIIIICIAASIPFILSYAEKNLSYLYAGLKIVFSQLKQFNIENFVNSNRSTSLRFEQIVFAIEHQDPLPFIGVGIGKALFMPESFYANYYYRTGLLGSIMHFAVIGYTIYWALYFSKCYAFRAKIKNNLFLTATFFSIAVYFISFPFDYLSAMVNDQTRTGFVFYVLVAIVCFYKKHHTDVQFRSNSVLCSSQNK